MGHPQRSVCQAMRYSFALHLSRTLPFRPKPAADCENTPGILRTAERRHKLEDRYNQGHAWHTILTNKRPRRAPNLLAQTPSRRKSPYPFPQASTPSSTHIYSKNRVPHRRQPHSVSVKHSMPLAWCSGLRSSRNKRAGGSRVRAAKTSGCPPGSTVVRSAFLSQGKLWFCSMFHIPL
jgi:hypothetical protein